VGGLGWEGGEGCLKFHVGAATATVRSPAGAGLSFVGETERQIQGLNLALNSGLNSRVGFQVQ